MSKICIRDRSRWGIFSFDFFLAGAAVGADIVVASFRFGLRPIPPQQLQAEA